MSEIPALTAVASPDSDFVVISCAPSCPDSGLRPFPGSRLKRSGGGVSSQHRLDIQKLGPEDLGRIPQHG
jgi:hypothetical protein